MIKFIIGLVFSFSTAFALNEVEKAYFGEQYNYLANPGFETNRAGWSASGGSFTHTIAASGTLFGGGNANWDSSAANQLLTATTIPASISTTNLLGLRGKTGEFSCFVRTPSGTSTYRFNVVVGGNTLTQTITSDPTGVRSTFFFPIPDQTGIVLTPRIESVASNEPQIQIDDCYFGLARGLTVGAVSEVFDAGTITIGGTTTAPTKGTTTTDKVTYHREGKFAVITYDYRQTTGGTAGSGDYLYSLPSGLSIDTTLNPIFTGSFASSLATVSRLDATGRQYTSVPQSLNIVGAFPWSSTQFRIGVQSEYSTTGFIGSGLSNLTTADYGFSFTVKVPIQGWSASQSAAAASQTDYGWTSYTPTTQGLGSPTNIECQHSRVSQDLLVRCKLTLGTTTASEMRINFPNNLVAAGTSVIPSIQKCGDANGGGSSGATFFGTSTVLCEPSVGYFTFGVNNNSNNGLTKVNGNIYTSSAAFSFTARVPIAGWEPNQRAPTLIGSVTSNSVGALRIESVRIAGANDTSSCTSTPCTGYRASSTWFSSITRSGSGSYVITANSGLFSSAPICQANCISCNPGGIIFSAANATSSTNINAVTGGTGALTDGIIEVTCWGPR